MDFPTGADSVTYVLFFMHIFYIVVWIPIGFAMGVSWERERQWNKRLKEYDND